MNSPLSAKQSEQELLSIFEKLCAHHRVKTPNSHLRSILEESCIATNGKRNGRRNNSSTSSSSHKASEPGFDDGGALPLECIDLSSVYLGPKQLMALADLMRPVRSGTPGAGSDEGFYFSLVPFLTRLSLADTQLDFTVSEMDGVRTRTTATPATDGTAVMRYVLEALHHHPSLAVLDLTGNPIGPHLFTALCRLLDATRTLKDLRLTGSLLLEDQISVLEAKIKRNELWCEAHRGKAWHCHYMSWKAQQRRWMRDTLSQDNAFRLFLNVRRYEEVADWVCHFSDVEMESFPFLQYYTHDVNRSFLSQRCVEMLQGAFNPSYFERMGVSVPANTPEAPYHFQYLVKEKEEVESLKYAIAHSNLLVALREVLFPTDPSEYDANLTSRTNQIRFDQWDMLLSRLAHFMVPAYYHMDEVVYYLNDRPYWLSFLPYSEGARSRVYVKQLFINKETGLYDEVFVHEGQFFGGEVLGGSSLYNAGNSLVHQRESTATVHSTADLPGAQREPAERILVWQLPFEIAFFFLFQPFCEFHSRTASRLRANPHVQSWAPHLQCLLSYVLHHGAVDEFGMVEEAPNGSVSTSLSTEFATAMNARRFKESVTLLLEGHFVLRGYDQSGKWHDRVIAAPAILVDSRLYAKDEPERKVMKQVWSPKEDASNSTHDPQVGKEFMLEQYRASRGSISTTESEKRGQPVALYAQRMSPYRWCWVENVHFETLPLAMRLCLTKKCIVL